MVDPVTEWRKRMFAKIGLAARNGERVLDIGCGDGGDGELFAAGGADVTGVDIAPHPNWERLKSGRLNFRTADACALPFSNKSFDLVFEKDTLHHLERPERALAEIRRVTRKGGRIVLIEANRYNPVFYLHMTLLEGHQHITRRRFRRLVDSFFAGAAFSAIEAHVYPTGSPGMRKTAYLIESILEKTLSRTGLLSYNIAVIKKDD